MGLLGRSTSLSVAYSMLFILSVSVNSRSRCDEVVNNSEQAVLSLPDETMLPGWFFQVTHEEVSNSFRVVCDRGLKRGNVAINHRSCVVFQAAARCTAEQLTQLRKLDCDLFIILQNNPTVDDDCAKMLAGIPRLIGIEINRCQHLTESGTANFASAQRMTFFGLINCTTLSVKQIEALSSAVSLSSLTLDSSDMSDGLCSAIASNSRLSRISLHGCRGVTDAGVRSLSANPHLKHLRLGSPCLTDEAIDSLSKLAGLETLWLEGSDSITSAIFSSTLMRRLIDLRLFGLASLWKGNGCPRDDLPRLKTFRVEACVACDDVALSPVMSRCTALCDLSLRGTPIKCLLEGELRFGESLRRLNIGDTAIQAESLANLAVCRNLEEIDLSGTSTNDASLAWLSKLTKLRVIKLERCKFSLRIFDFLKDAPDLEQLHVSPTLVIPVARLAELRKSCPSVVVHRGWR